MPFLWYNKEMISSFEKKALNIAEPIDVQFSHFDAEGSPVSNECFQFHKRIFEILEAVSLDAEVEQYEKIKKRLGIEKETKENVEKIIVRVRKARIESLQPEIELFRNKVLQKFPKPNDRAQIFNAFNTALDIHIDEKDRLEGQPYFGHALEIAWRLLNDYGTQDPNVIISGLLHDTVENNAFKIADRKEMQWFDGSSDKETIENAAFIKIKNIFGERVSRSISALSKPNFEKMIAAQQSLGRTKDDLTLKTEYYKAYIENLVTNENAFAVKYVDFEVNAIEILDRFPEDSTFAKEKKLRQMKKYYHSFPVFLKTFENIGNDCLLFPYKDEIIAKLEYAKRQYELYFQEKNIEYTSL